MLSLLISAFLHLLVLATDLSTSWSLLLGLAHRWPASISHRLVSMRTALAIETRMTYTAMGWSILRLHVMLSELANSVNTLVSLHATSTHWIARHTWVCS